jgi:hypothetical protein
MKIDPNLKKILSSYNVNNDGFLYVSHNGYGPGNICYVNIRFCRRHPITNSKNDNHLSFHIVFDEYIDQQFKKDATLYYSGSGSSWDCDIKLKTDTNLSVYVNFEVPKKRGLFKNILYLMLDEYFSTLGRQRK